MPPLAPSASTEEILDVLRIVTSVFEREWRVAIGCMCPSIGTALLTAARKLAAGVQALEAGIARASAAEPLSFERKEREQIRFAIEALEALQPRRPTHLVHLTDYVRAIRALIKVYPSLTPKI